jgi:hypothetical protein
MRSIPLLALALGGLVTLAGCGNGETFTTEAAVKGAADAHCGSTVQKTDQAVCKMMGTATPADYGDTMDGSEGDDDDCKYHVTWSSSTVAENQDVTFQVVATNKTDEKPVTGAQTALEVFLDDMHEAPPTAQATVESPPGTYTIAPFQFDKPGKWTIRFHFFEECTDVSEESPHAHAAFYVNVP